MKIISSQSLKSGCVFSYENSRQIELVWGDEEIDMSSEDTPVDVLVSYDQSRDEYHIKLNRETIVTSQSYAVIITELFHLAIKHKIE